MNKFRILILLIAVLAIAEGTGLVYFAHKSQGLAKRLKSAKPDVEAANREKKEMQIQYQKLLKESELIKKDRENILNQTKNLMSEQGKAEELKVSLEKLKKEYKVQLSKTEIEQKEVISERDSLKSQNTKLQGVIKQLMDMQRQLESDKIQFKDAYESLKDKSKIKDFKKTISGMAKKNKTLSNNLVTKERELDKLTKKYNKREEKVEDLTKNLDEYKIRYKDAAKKNKALEKQIRNIPKKFAEIGRQNKKLLKETSRMHYNLGVFYTAHKEYTRAVAEFEKAVDIDPTNSYAHFNLGYIYAEHMVSRRKAIIHFRHFLEKAKGEDKDTDWAKKYILTWETYEGKSSF